MNVQVPDRLPFSGVFAKEATPFLAQNGYTISPIGRPQQPKASSRIRGHPCLVIDRTDAPLKRPKVNIFHVLIVAQSAFWIPTNILLTHRIDAETSQSPTVAGQGSDRIVI